MQFLIIALFLPFSWITISYLLYRLPASKKKRIFNAEVHFRFVNLGVSNRAVFENMLSNSLLHLVEQPSLYVSKSEYAKIWVESPHDLQKKGITLNVKLTASELLFGGYGVSEILAVHELQKDPVMSK